MNDEIQYVKLGPEDEARRRRRSVAIAWTIAALVVLIFITTIVRLGANVADRAVVG